MNTNEMMSELALAQGQARLDRLTGLGNLLALDEVLGQCFREGRPFSFVLFDLANLKQANDALGYEGANEVLRRVAGVLRRHRGDGYAFRQGGDEFLVILPGASPESARPVRDRVEKAAGVEIFDGGVSFIAGGIGDWKPGKIFGEEMKRAQRRMERRKAQEKGALSS